MQPVTPVISEEFASNEVIYAKNQPEYNPLPTIKRSDGVVLSRWKPTDSEREAIAAGADIMLYIWTFNQPLQPIAMSVCECGNDVIHMAQFMEIIP